MTPAAPVERLDLSARWLPPWVVRQHLRRYAWAAHLVAGRQVLDIACGTGYGSEMLARAGAARVVGADVDPQAIDVARERVTDARCEFLIADATATPFAHGRFDIVVSFETIEHLAHDAAFLAEMRRVVRPGGWFVCSTPNRDVMNAGTTIRDGSFNPHHVREYDPAEFTAALAAHFESVELFGQAPYPSRYVGALRTIGTRWPPAAVRVHQGRKLLGALVGWHPSDDVRAMTASALPEIMVARCRR